MTENFKSIKNKYMRIAIVASVAAGVSCGVIVAFALLLIFKLCGVNFHWALYLPIGIAAAGLSGFLFFLLFRPTDKKLAKKLDKDFGLNEKVQTMVEYANGAKATPASDEGVYADMLVMQREQTDAALGEVAKKKMDFSYLWKFVFIPVLAVALLFAGVFVPAKKTSSGVYDPPYDITEGQETALLELINDVNSSSLTDTLKVSVVEVLNSLLEGVRSAQQQSVMRRAVISAVSIIDNIFASVNSCVKINNALKADPTVSPLVNAMVDGITFYQKRGSTISSFDLLTAREGEADKEIGDALDEWRENFVIDFGNAAGVAQAHEQALAFAKALEDGIVRAELGDGEDALRDSFTGLVSAIRNISTEGSSLTLYQGNLGSVCTEFTEACGAASSVQSYNCMMDEFLRARLATIFRINRSEFGGNEHVVPGGSKTTDPDEIVKPEPGYRPSNPVYGSDDIVLDPDSGEYVEYGRILNDYNAAVTERLQQGETGAEIAKYIRQYFNALYGGIKEEE